MALWYNQTAKLKVSLQVVPLVGWKRADSWAETGLKFVPPSPNIRTPTGALLYPGMGLFEATNISVGRGTDSPFERVGAPWIDGPLLEGHLNALQMPGVRFTHTVFEPGEDPYVGHLCSGVRVEVVDPRLIRPVDIFIQMACALREMYPDRFVLRWDEIARVTGTHDFEILYKAGKTAADIQDVFHKSADTFSKNRKTYLLYP
jgi:uncharacterized protein YbbC (DUF1343 family)